MYLFCKGERIHLKPVSSCALFLLYKDPASWEAEVLCLSLPITPRKVMLQHLPEVTAHTWVKEELDPEPCSAVPWFYTLSGKWALCLVSGVFSAQRSIEAIYQGSTMVFIKKALKFCLSLDDKPVPWILFLMSDWDMPNLGSQALLCNWMNSLDHSLL